MDDEPVNVALRMGDVRALRQLAMASLRRSRKELAASTFVPEPGKQDAKAFKVKKLTQLIYTLDQYIR